MSIAKTSQSAGFLSPAEPVCPASLLELAQARTPARVAIARAGASLPMQAAKAGVEAGIMIPIFVGETADIHAEAAKLNWDISDFPLVDATGEEDAGRKAAELCGSGGADILMKGQLHTDVFMKTALARDAGLRTGARLLHVFHISPPDGGRPILISDAAVNVSPNMETRHDAIRAVVQIFTALGNNDPKIAILSATENPIPSVPSAVEARALQDWARAEFPNLKISGPLALDLILSPAAAAVKGLTGDPVAGRADAVITPDIVSGNTLFKALVYLSGGCAAGLVMGAKTPILLTSRADPAAARLASIALAAILAPKRA